MYIRIYNQAKIFIVVGLKPSKQLKHMIYLWVGIENIILTEETPAQKDKHWMFSLMESFTAVSLTLSGDKVQKDRKELLKGKGGQEGLRERE